MECKMKYPHYPYSFFFLCTLLFFPVAGQETYDGYTFVFRGQTAFLYDMNKEIVNEWSLPYFVSACADLLRDSSIIYMTAAEDDAGKNLTGIPLPGGRLQRLDWEGNVTWDFTYAGPDYLPHHDIEPVYRTNDPTEDPTILLVVATTWGDKIVEIRPKGTDDADIIWEWAASDHRCRSDCTDKIGLLDGTKCTPGGANDAADIMHTNNVSYNPFLDQIIINMKGFYEFIVIDHSTTTEEARGSSGGKCGKGGDILYRWGNPDTYGVAGAAFFEGQHGTCWIPLVMPGTTDSIPGGGNFLAVDNINERVVEIECPGEKDGIYPRGTGEAFGPQDVLWSYSPEFLQPMEGSIQKLPNGNYFICTGGFIAGTHAFEVSPKKEVVWDLSEFQNSTEACRYAYGYLNGEKTSSSSRQHASDRFVSIICTHYGSGKLPVSVKNHSIGARLSIFTLDGRVLVKSVAPNRDNGWEIPVFMSGGMYLLRIATGKDVHWNRLFLQP